jgi:large exoprotein involved in heme utilization and adhesion
MAESNNPLALPSDFDSEQNGLNFAIQQAMLKLQTALPVRVMAVRNAGLAPVGQVDIQVLVDMVDGQGNTVQHGTISNVPYFRLQGGTNAVIVDPSPGDIGMACFCSRDISAVKSVKDAAPPGSWRSHDFSDALYLGGFLNGTPTSYIQITDGGILVHNTSGVKLGDTGADVRRLVDERMLEWANSHTHGSGPVPDIPMGDGQLTTLTKAN